MKFYGIAMQGKFVNQTVNTVPPIFDHDKDTGRLVYNEGDGLLWWGDGEHNVWKSIAEGGIDKGETEDMYSDLLRTSIFLNCTWQDFGSNMASDPFIDESASTPILSDNWDPNLRAYRFTASGQTLTSNPIFVDAHVSLTEIKYCMASCHWVDTHPHNNPPSVFIDAGSGFEAVTNNDVHKIVTPGTTLRIKIVSSGEGYLMSWGILYNKDLSVDNSKYALTQREFNITGDTTSLTVDYQPGYVLVYLNGILLQDGNDYTATSGTVIDFNPPALKDGDVVLVVSFGTSAMIDDNELAGVYIKRNGSVDWDSGVTQSVGGGKFTQLGDGVASTDSVNIRQLNEDDFSVNRHSKLYGSAINTIGIPAILDTSDDKLDMRHHKITNVADGTADKDAVHFGQFEQSQHIIIFPGGTFMAWGVMRDATSSGNPGKVYTINPKTSTGESDIGVILDTRSIEIQTVQVTHKGNADVGDLTTVDSESKFLHLKTEFIEGHPSFNVGAFRTDAGGGNEVKFSWFITGQVVS